jgi:PAS domain S-box-containing protein
MLTGNFQTTTSNKDSVIMAKEDQTVLQTGTLQNPARLDSHSPDDRINILLVDDEPKNLTVLESILHDPRYRLVKAASADEALLALVAEEFGLLILDIQMPDMNGFELAQMIRQRKKTAGVPIIFLTAYYNEDQHVLEGYESGAVDYLHKPVNATILRSKVAGFAQLNLKTRQLALANRMLLAEIGERRSVQEELQRLNNDLERRVTERTVELEQSNAALRESEQRLRATQTNAPIGVVETSPDGEVYLSVNDEYCRLTGFTSEELLQRKVSDIGPPDDWAIEQDLYRRMVAGEFPTFRLEKRRIRKDGTTVWVDVNRTLVRDADGRPQYVIGAILDIAERKKAEEELRRRELLESVLRSQEAERHRIARDLHDHLGQQLTGLRLALTDVEKSLGNAPGIMEKVEKVQKISVQLDRDVSLLAFELHAKILSERGLRAALKQFVSEWSRSHQIRADFHAIDPSARKRLPVEVETHLYRIAQEALNNTLKYAKAANVSVLLEIRDGEIRLIVEDDGIGFDLNSKAKAARKPGRGLGLTSMKERADLLGGRLEIETTPGRGTTVFVNVPVTKSLPGSKRKGG